MARNADRAVLTADHQTRQRMLSRELQELNRSHRTEVCNDVFYRPYHACCIGDISMSPRERARKCHPYIGSTSKITAAIRTRRSTLT